MNQHWLRKDEQREVIRRVMTENDVTVRRRDDNWLKLFVVKGEGLFRCAKCGNSWSSHHCSIKVDLSRARVFKLYRQQCQQCPTRWPITHWPIPHFTSDRFKDMIIKVIHMYKQRKNGYRDNRPSPVHGKTQGPHEREDCERCLELGPGRHC